MRCLDRNRYNKMFRIVRNVTIPMALGYIGYKAYFAYNTETGIASTNGGVYDYIVVGGGTAGCATAYYLSKWHPMKPKVLLIEAGSDEKLDPKMGKWFENWSKSSVVHDTTSKDKDFCPAIASSHIGLGEYRDVLLIFVY